MRSHLRHVPAVDSCLRALCKASPDLLDVPHALLRDLVNEFLSQKRLEIINARECPDLSLDTLLPALLAHVRKFLNSSLQPVLNASGVIIHTNLGRSILAQEAAEAVAKAARGYCNLELDLESGERGSRHRLTEDLVCRLTGAEAAMVVNNNAAAVLLMLDSLCAGGEVIVSRGELVEIGGSFRIPDIMAKSGAKLIEVGTTNKTHYSDYQSAINENTRAIMRVHASNFRIIGFHDSVSAENLKNLAAEHNLPFIYDLGSGSLVDFSAHAGLPPEPTVSQAVAAGADLVSFSGDKALGGPQAGIIAGKKILVEKCKANQLSRALRCDKLCLAALEATLRLYLDTARAIASVPTAKMMCMGAKELASAAHSLGRRIKARAGDKLETSFCKANSAVGGGAYPECGLPTTLVRLRPLEMSAQKLRARLLSANPPLIGRLEKDFFCLDPRTLLKEQYEAVAKIIAWAVNERVEA